MLVDRLNILTPIVRSDGAPAEQFQILWQRVCERLEQQYATHIAYHTEEGLKFEQSGGVGRAPATWHEDFRVWQVYSAGLAGNLAGTIGVLTLNTYWDGTNYRAFDTGGGAVLVMTTAGDLTFSKLSSAASGDPQTQTDRWTVTTDGHFILNASAVPVGSANATVLFGGTLAGIVYLYRTAGTDMMRFHVAGAQVGAITTTGSATTYTTSSDHRLKNVDGPIVASEAVAFISALQPKKGTWKVDDSPFAGFVAHELQAVSPSSVSGEHDAVDGNGNPIFQSIDAGTPEIIANLVAVVKHLLDRIETLESA